DRYGMGREAALDPADVVAANERARDAFREGMGEPEGPVEAVGSVVGRMAGEVAPYLASGPVAGLAVTATKAADRENSLTGFAADMAGDSPAGRVLDRLAESTPGRMVTDAAVDLATMGAVRGV